MYVKLEVVNQTLLAIKGKSKTLLPERVVNAARSPDSPIHDCFTWDDDDAAEKWRLEEARMLIRRCTVKMDGDGEPTPVFVSLMSDRETGGYRDVPQVLNSKELIRELERTAAIELEGWQKRHAMLTGLIRARVLTTAAKKAKVEHKKAITPKRVVARAKAG